MSLELEPLPYILPMLIVLSRLSPMRGISKTMASPYLSKSWRRLQMEHFPRYWPFVNGIHRSPVDSSHKSQWRVALLCSLIFAWPNGWAKNRDAGDLRRHGTDNDVIVMLFLYVQFIVHDLFVTMEYEIEIVYDRFQSCKQFSLCPLSLLFRFKEIHLICQ